MVDWFGVLFDHDEWFEGFHFARNLMNVFCFVINGTVDIMVMLFVKTVGEEIIVLYNY